jgi:DNA-binding MurR/RpiR family transcriptional regulator
MKEISRPEFKDFILNIDSADRIFIIGLRSIYSLAIFLGFCLDYLYKNVTVIQPGIGDMWDRLLGLKPGDLVIAISFPRYTSETIEVLQFAKSRGTRTLAITDSVLSPLAKYADHLLTARYKMDSFTESLTAALSLINAIVTGAAVHGKIKTMQSLKDLEKLWEIHRVYHEEGRETVRRALAKKGGPRVIDKT